MVCELACEEANTVGQTRRGRIGRKEWKFLTSLTCNSTSYSQKNVSFCLFIIFRTYAYCLLWENKIPRADHCFPAPRTAFTPAICIQTLEIKIAECHVLLPGYEQRERIIGDGVTTLVQDILGKISDSNSIFQTYYHESLNILLPLLVFF